MGKESLTRERSNEEIVTDIQAGRDRKENLSRLWDKNTRLICQEVRRYRQFGADDVQQEAFLALYEAVMSFSHERGANFATWMVNCLRWHFARWIKAQPEPLLSLDAEMKDQNGESSTLADYIAGPECTETAAEAGMLFNGLSEALDRCCEGMTAAEEIVFRARYISQMSRKEAAREYGLTERTVACREAAALRRVRRYHWKELRPFLDAADEARYSDGLKGTGYTRFNETWTSATERAAFRNLREEWG